jgi:hypothetical protein
MRESSENSTAVLVVVEPNALLPSRVFDGCNGSAIAVIAGLDRETPANALARIRKRATDFGSREIQLQHAVLVISLGLGGSWKDRRHAIARELARHVQHPTAKLVLSAPGADRKLRNELSRLAASLVTFSCVASVSVDFEPMLARGVATEQAVACEPRLLGPGLASATRHDVAPGKIGPGKIGHSLALCSGETGQLF